MTVHNINLLTVPDVNVSWEFCEIYICHAWSFNDQCFGAYRLALHVCKEDCLHTFIIPVQLDVLEVKDSVETVASNFLCLDGYFFSSASYFRQFNYIQSPGNMASQDQ